MWIAIAVILFFATAIGTMFEMRCKECRKWFAVRQDRLRGVPYRKCKSCGALYRGSKIYGTDGNY